ncbi:MAG TPA: DUF6062 family protein [Ktedonobacteraceae bacterium]|nr:DUF6062 family protein [Ktedonobacteraceae bacterium]
MQSSRETQQLLEASQRRGCLLCRLGQENVQHYLDSWKYELFTDVGIREELRRSRGFCNTHTWQLARMGATLQLAVAYRDILSDTTEQLQASQTASRRHRWFKPESEREQVPCPACVQQQKAVVNLVPFLRQAVLDPTFYTQFLASDGLCLEHFQQTCELKLPGSAESTVESLAQLRQAQLTILKRLDAQLGELIRKHDYRFRDEAQGDEMVSWRWAASIVAGEDDRVNI